MQYENRKNWGGNGGKLMDVKQIMGERLVSLQMVFAKVLSWLVERAVSLQMVFATAFAMGGRAFLKRCKFHLQRLMVWVE